MPTRVGGPWQLCNRDEIKKYRALRCHSCDEAIEADGTSETPYYLLRVGSDARTPAQRAAGAAAAPVGRRRLFCTGCFGDAEKRERMPDASELEAMALPVGRDDSEVMEMVQCDFCDSWYHQMCVLFNRREHRRRMDRVRCALLLCSSLCLALRCLA